MIQSSWTNEDARYQTLEQLHERRKQVVRLHRKGYGVMSIVELSGLSTKGAESQRALMRPLGDALRSCQNFHVWRTSQMCR